MTGKWEFGWFNCFRLQKLLSLNRDSGKPLLSPLNVLLETISEQTYIVPTCQQLELGFEEEKWYGSPAGSAQISL